MAVQPITQLTSATNWLFALKGDGSIFVSDSTATPLVWTSLPYGGTGLPIHITGVCFPGPMGLSYLFILADNDTLWSYQSESGEWLQRVYTPG